MKAKYQMVHTYTFDNNRGGSGEHTSKSSFKTLENAIRNANFWINKEEAWIDVTTVRVYIMNKETCEVLYEWSAEPVKTMTLSELVEDQEQFTEFANLLARNIKK